MLHEMIFTNARLILPDGIRDGLEVVAEQGKIAAIRPPIPRQRGKEIIDLNGNYLAPGFIDLHVHGAIGRDTMTIIDRVLFNWAWYRYKWRQQRRPVRRERG